LERSTTIFEMGVRPIVLKFVPAETLVGRHQEPLALPRPVDVDRITDKPE
jgi:hypothetical protein